jgi:hypothetical protein
MSGTLAVEGGSGGVLRTGPLGQAAPEKLSLIRHSLKGHLLATFLHDNVRTGEGDRPGRCPIHVPLFEASRARSVGCFRVLRLSHLCVEDGVAVREGRQHTAVWVHVVLFRRHLPKLAPQWEVCVSYA